MLACIFIASADWLIVDIIAPLSVLFATVVVNPFTVAVISVTLLLALFAVVSIDDILPLKPLTVCSNVEVLSDTVLMDASTSSGAGTHVGALSPSTKMRLW